jgi:amidophosphoribosyltransferase
MNQHIHEECGVFGIFAPENKDVAALTYYGLYALQHRGQEGCGIAVNDDGVITYHKDVGLVQDVFTPQVLENLGEGSIAVGHTRYGTYGTKTRSNCQPMVALSTSLR